MATDKQNNEKETADLMVTVEEALDKLPLEDIKTVITLAEGMVVKRQGEAKEALLSELSEFKERAAKLGISLGSLGTAKAGKKTGKKSGTVAVKYRGPNQEAWSGRGRVPSWVAALEKEGHNREEFREQAAQ